ncbi:hypothetical protein ACPA9J_31835 [Pseudomonas aeruginosa]
MARLDPALAEEIRRLADQPASGTDPGIAASRRPRGGAPMAAEWPRIASPICRAGTADAPPLAEMLKRLGR